MFTLDVACFSDYLLTYDQKAVQMHSPLNIKFKRVIDISLLKKIVEQCDYTYIGQISKALYLLSFALISGGVKFSEAGFTFNTFYYSGGTFAFKNMAPGRRTVCGGNITNKLNMFKDKLSPS